MKKMFYVLLISFMFVGVSKSTQAQAGIGGLVIKGTGAIAKVAIKVAIKNFFKIAIKKAPKMVMNFAKKKAKSKITSLIKTQKDKNFAIKEIKKYSSKKEYSHLEDINSLLSVIEAFKIPVINKETSED